MKCPRCQHENPPKAKFCQECAAPLARACANCGTPLPATAKFCLECAHPVAPGPAAQPRFASPEAYTPKYLAEKILTSKSSLEGERKQVTVLFADLKASMELLADRDPEEARKLLDPVLEHMMEAVHRYEGTVNQVMGDGIMALFGAPLAHEDHAVRASYAALRMQESVKRYAEGVRRTEGIPIQIRLGLNSGEVVVRSIGSDLHMDYTAVGQTTHLAARMEQMATPGSILIPSETLSLVEGYVVVKPLGPMPVKGLETPIEVYEVIGATTVRSRLHAAAARGLTRFVGRDSELEQLRQALELARTGHGQVVAVVGEPGVGKSRLFWEFTHSHRTQDWVLLESSSVSYGKATTFLPLIDLLRGYFQIEARDEARKIREKVTGKLLSLDRALEPSLPALLWLLDVPVDDPQWQRLDPLERRRRTLDGIKRLLLRESQVQPLLVLFEDLHWIDAETQAFLDSLIESLPTARLLLLVNYRPEYQHGWSGKTYYRLLRIDPLPPESAEELLEGLLGNDPGLQPLKRLLIERTEGNPFFLEESVRTLVETKVLAGDRGAYRVAKASQSLQIPATAQAILAARIDRLSPEDKRLLQAASVIGKDVSFVLLQAIAELPEEDLRRGLTHLQAAEFLYEARLFPDLEYTFKHAMTHDVAYGGLLHERRKALHAKILGVMENFYADRLGEQVERLAHHALHGEVWEKAVTYFRQAGSKVEARTANREAVGYFEQALGALAHLPETREGRERAIDLRFELRRPLLVLGDTERFLAYLREAGTLAEALGDESRRGWALGQLSGAAWSTGDHTQALALGKQAYEIAVTAGEFALRVHMSLRLGWAYQALGDYRQAMPFFRENVTSVQGDLVRERFGHIALPAVHSRLWLGWCLAELGEFTEALAHAEDGLQIADAADHMFSQIAALSALGMIRLRAGDLQKAIPPLERGHQLCEATQAVGWMVWGTSFLGLAYAQSGRVDEALPILEAIVGAAESRKFLFWQAIRVAALGEAYLRAGRIDDAWAQGLRALDLARRQGERGHEAWSRRLLGEIASHRDPAEVESADEHYRQTLALAAELSMRPLVAHCHLGLGSLYRGTGKRQQAHEHLATATAMYREIDLRFWLEKAEAELKALG